MAHIAVITSGLTGILHASFEIVARLKGEGHEVTYLCPYDVQAKVVDKGIVYVQLPSINFSYWSSDNRLFRSFPKRVVHHFNNLKSQNTLGKKTLKIKEIEEVLTSVSPDKIIIDLELHELIYSALKLKIPFTLLSQWFPNLKYSNVPPIKTTIIPGIGFKGSKTGISFTWKYTKIKARCKQVILQLFLKNYRRSVLKKYGKEMNISTSSLKLSVFPPHFHYKEWPTMHMVLKEMDFPQKRFPNMIYLGPMVFDARDRDNEITDPEIVNIFDAKKKENYKIIYCSVSTLNKGDISFVKKVINAVKDQKNWSLIVSLGGKLSKKDFENIPDNVILKEWMPQLQILKNADCSINHGGIHTINECIHFKVPMLVYSGKHHDQNGCAARVAYHHIGLVGDKDGDSSDMIKAKIEILFTQPKYLNKMNEMYEKYEVARGINLTTQLQ